MEPTWTTTQTAARAAAPCEGLAGVDWADLALNGMPAVQRALARLEQAQLHLLAALTAAEARVTELEYLWSEEIMRQLAAPAGGSNAARTPPGEC